jgi:hypothetical protein
MEAKVLKIKTNAKVEIAIIITMTMVTMIGKQIAKAKPRSNNKNKIANPTKSIN